MLMAITLRSVRMGRCLRFSMTSLFSNLLVGYDYLLGRRRNRVHFTARESGILKHALQFVKGVRIAAGRRAEHHQAERGRSGRSYAVGIRHEFKRYRTASRR